MTRHPFPSHLCTSTAATRLSGSGLANASYRVSGCTKEFGMKKINQALMEGSGRTSHSITCSTPRASTSPVLSTSPGSWGNHGLLSPPSHPALSGCVRRDNAVFPTKSVCRGPSPFYFKTSHPMFVIFYLHIFNSSSRP